MLARWPSEFIHAVKTASADVCPRAMFSPCMRLGLSEFHDWPFGLVCENFCVSSFALVSVALFRRVSHVSSERPRDFLSCLPYQKLSLP